MPESSNKRITRSRNRNRHHRPGAHKTASNAKLPSLRGKDSPSPSHNSLLPGNIVNKEPGKSGLHDGVSSLQPSKATKQNNCSKDSGGSDSGLTRPAIIRVSIPNKESVTLGASPSSKVSDNMSALEGVQAPGQEYSSFNTIPPGPTDPLIQIMADLREIKADTQKLVKIESSVESLSNQISEVTQRTLKLEAVVEGTSARFTEIDRELRDLRSEVGAQAKSLAEMRNLRTFLRCLKRMWRK